MGKTVLVVRVRSMHLVLYCSFLCVSILPFCVTARDLDIYPELDADDAIIQRIQNVLTTWRENQLRILQNSRERQGLPQFTFHFPEEPAQTYQHGFFAITPSDPRYYKSDADLLEAAGKRVENDEGVEEYQNVSPETVDESWPDDVTSEANDSQIDKAEEFSNVFKKLLKKDDQDIVLVAIVAGCGAAAAAGVIALTVGWYKLHSHSKAAADIEYPAYGVTGPNKEITPTSGDRRLAQSAQMYHYQHQKQQIIAMESNRANNERRGSVSEGDSEEENEEGDYTVYECPGLAATGELEVKNPLFLDDPTPATGNHTEVPTTPADKK